MNNRQAGRRRGRGGQRQGGNPGRPDNGNRIDNRARGNAAQLLEKYKSLASDSQRSGDRVNTEYYLQFADHYFRVLAETRSRFEEQGQGQQGRRPRDDEDGDDEDYGFEGEVGTPAAFGQGPQTRDRDDEDEREARREEARREPRRGNGNGNGNDEAPRREARGGNGNGGDRDEAPRREPRNVYRDRDAEPRANDDRDSRPVAANDESRGEPRRRPRARREDVVEADGFDAAVLPPAIAVDATPADDAAERPRRGRPRRVRNDDDEAVPPAA